MKTFDGQIIKDAVDHVFYDTQTIRADCTEIVSFFGGERVVGKTDSKTGIVILPHITNLLTETGVHKGQMFMIDHFHASRIPDGFLAMIDFSFRVDDRTFNKGPMDIWQDKSLESPKLTLDALRFWYVHLVPIRALPFDFSVRMEVHGKLYRPVM